MVGQGVFSWPDLVANFVFPSLLCVGSGPLLAFRRVFVFICGHFGRLVVIHGGLTQHAPLHSPLSIMVTGDLVNISYRWCVVVHEIGVDGVIGVCYEYLLTLILFSWFEIVLILLYLLSHSFFIGFCVYGLGGFVGVLLLLVGIGTPFGFQREVFISSPWGCINTYHVALPINLGYVCIPSWLDCNVYEVGVILPVFDEFIHFLCHLTCPYSRHIFLLVFAFVPCLPQRSDLIPFGPTLLPFHTHSIFPQIILFRWIVWIWFQYGFPLCAVSTSLLFHLIDSDPSWVPSYSSPIWTITSFPIPSIFLHSDLISIHFWKNRKKGLEYQLGMNSATIQKQFRNNPKRWKKVGIKKNQNGNFQDFVFFLFRFEWRSWNFYFLLFYFLLLDFFCLFGGSRIERCNISFEGHLGEYFEK